MIQIVDSKIREYDSIQMKIDSQVREYDSIQVLFVSTYIEFLISFVLFLRKKTAKISFFLLKMKLNEMLKVPSLERSVPKPLKLLQKGAKGGLFFVPRDSLTLRCRPPTPLVVEVK